jgi:DedD protein
MAFFKFRKSGDDQPGPAALSESVEAMRKRATLRLIGAAVLVLAGVIGFPLLFDSQPRPIPVNVAIEIPDKAKVKPLPAPVVSAPPVLEDKPAVAPEAAPPSVPVAVDSKKLIQPETSAEKKALSLEKEAKLAIKKEEILPKKDSISVKESEKISKEDGGRALALLDGKTPAPAPTPAAGESRFVVQVGAYSDADRVKEARAKLESAGLKTYAQVVQTKDGPRTRVRVGPFTDRAEADRVAQKVKALALPAAILAL